MKLPYTSQAIFNLYPGSLWSLEGEDYDTLEWRDTQKPKPSKVEIETEAKRLALEEKANEYKEQRAMEYPPIGEQLDALFKAGVFPEEMAAQIQAIKDKYPKP